MAIVLGVTLSVCDARLQDDEFDSNALVVGSAIAAGIISGDNWVRIGDFMLMHGTYVIDSPQIRDGNITIPQSYNSNMVLIINSCKNTNGTGGENTNSTIKTNITDNIGRADYVHNTCGENKTLTYSIIGKNK